MLEARRLSFVVPALAASMTMVACALSIAAVLARLRKSYVPFDRTTYSPLVFVHYRLPDAYSSFREIAIVLGVWFATSCAAALLLKRRGGGNGAVIAIVLLQSVLLAIVFAGRMPLDSDQYAYIGYGAALEQHQNPYHATPLTAGASLAAQRVASHWGNPLLPDPYGPLWTLSDASALWPFRNLSVDVQARMLRLLAALAALASSLLVAGILRDSGWRNVALAAFALNPLVVLETANGAHNDIFMVLCALIAAYALRRDALVVAGFWLGCAIAIKFAYAPLVVPFAAYAYVRSQSVVRAAGGLVAVVVPIVLSAAPFGLRNSLLTPLLRRTDVLSRLPLFDRLSPHLTYFMVIAGICICALAAATTILRGRSGAAALPLIVLSILTSLFADKIEPWYALMLAPLVLLGGYGGVATFIGISAASLAMLSGSFLNVFPTTLTLGVAAVLVVALRYAVADKSGASLTTMLRPSSLPS